ncbi:MAG: hypothetical protein IPO15_14120 [Anaerolineae bacterium]|uniref:hypothetical protein n=1 Tax=Candidatus Amarolinea dominans TaxID=3140696 RepID=UPI0031353EAD|nr:hypothetical protein [Anaerolineae bacterium]
MTFGPGEHDARPPTVSALHVAGLGTAPPPAAPAADETNQLRRCSPASIAPAESDGPGPGGLVDRIKAGFPAPTGNRAYQAADHRRWSTTSRAERVAGASRRKGLPVNLPDFQPPGEATVLVRRQTNAGASDSSHLHLHRRADNTWRVVGALLDIPLRCAGPG